MIWTLFQFLIVMWMVGVATGHTLGGMIHILPVLALASAARQVIIGRLALLRSRL